MLGALFLMGCAIFVPVFSKTLPVLCFGFVFEGIPWGIFQVSPLRLEAELEQNRMLTADIDHFM